mmetsp:Transcript_21733/g.32092  ORF Transcript_21733/g.32092 Transcript_21733/m.32092 type:complete len:273 (-) Transcript_21733:150-968(-)
MQEFLGKSKKSDCIPSEMLFLPEDCESSTINNSMEQEETDATNIDQGIIVTLNNIYSTETNVSKENHRMVFPAKLYKMLQHSELQNKGLQVIRWDNEGESFTVLDPDKFSATLLPMFFRTRKLHSFKRQLRAYGFIRMKTFGGPKRSLTYTHFIFRRDHPENLNKITRRNNSETSITLGEKHVEKMTGIKKTNAQKTDIVLQPSTEGNDDDDNVLNFIDELQPKFWESFSFSLRDWNAEKESLSTNSSVGSESSDKVRSISVGSLFDLFDDI